MTKDELLSQFENAGNNFIMGLAAAALFASEESYPILKKSSCKFGTYTVTFSQVVGLLSTAKGREIAIKEFINMLLRSLTLDSVELIRDYCDTTKQTQILANQPWYQFARLMRDCISNASRFKFGDFDRHVLPVNWRGKEITTEMDGTYLQLSFFGHVEAWELFQEIKDFARDGLI